MKKILVLFIWLFIFQNLCAQKEYEKAKIEFEKRNFSEVIANGSKALLKLSVRDPKYYEISEIVSESYFEKRNAVDLEALSLKNYKLYKANFGDKDTTVIQALSNLCSVSFIYGEFEQGIKYSQEIKEILIYNKLEGTETDAQLDNNFGYFYTELGDYEKASRYFDSALRFFEKDLEKNKIEISTIYVNLGNLYQYLNDFEKATQVYEEVLTIHKKSPFTDFELFDLYLGYSTLESELNKLDHALELVQKCEVIANKLQDDYTLSSVYNNLGVIYNRMGNYNLAEKYLQKSYEMTVRYYGDSHAESFKTKNNLAVFYMGIEQFEKSEKLLDEIITIIEKDKTDKFNNKKCTYYNNLANLYNLESKYVLSKKYFLKTLEHEVKLIGTEKASLLYINNLCLAYLNLQDYQSAEKLYLDYNIESRLEYENKSDVALIYNNLSEIEYLKENYESALLYANKAEEIIRNEFGNGGVSAHHILLKKGKVLLKLEKKEEAAKVLSTLCEEYISFVEQIFITLTDQEKNIYTRRIQLFLDVFYESVYQLNPQNTSYNEAMFNYRLRTKSIALRYGKDIFDQVVNGDNEKLKVLAIKLMEERKAYARYIAMSKADLKSYGVDIDYIKNIMQLLEKDFLQQASDYLEVKKQKEFKELHAQLLGDEALIEIVKIIEHYDEVSLDYHYAALIVKKNTNYPILVKLSKKEIESKYYSYYLNTIFNKKEDVLSYKIFWEPIDQELNGIKKIIYSPDGIYHKINVNTLYDPVNKKYNFERYLIKQHLSLLAYEAAKYKNIQKVALFGNPNYYLDLAPIFEAIEKDHVLPTRAVSVSFQSWSELPGTKKEIELISDHLIKSKIEVEVYSEEYALENYFKTLENPDIIHIASHGFFEAFQDTLEDYSTKSYTEPMFHNGIVLAGGGASSDGFLPKSDSKFFQDGLLNAYEVSLMDLSQTQLVVLSACNSGQGIIRNEEGVFGLQRGFAIAGAKYILASLWEVDDNATQEFMVEFYKQLTILKDFESAYQITMKIMSEKYKDAYYWGAFNLIKL